MGDAKLERIQNIQARLRRLRMLVADLPERQKVMSFELIRADAAFIEAMKLEIQHLEEELVFFSRIETIPAEVEAI